MPSSASSRSIPVGFMGRVDKESEKGWLRNCGLLTGLWVELGDMQFMPKHVITAMPLTVPASHTVPASSHPPAALAYGSYLDLLLACRTQEALPSLVQVCVGGIGAGRDLLSPRRRFPVDVSGLSPSSRWGGTI